MNNQLEVIQKALEMGAIIEINFHSVTHNFSKSQAEEVAKELSEGLGIGYQKCVGHDWFETERKWGQQCNLTIHFKASKEDEIQRLKEQIARLEQEETA